MSVAVLIPTYRRNEALADVIRSVLVQTRLPDEILVVDNDPKGGARETVEGLSLDAAAPILYVHEPRPGVSNARNTGFARTQARFIAQLDDDETADVNWLETLLSARQTLDAPVIFGPVIAQVSPNVRGQVRSAYMQRLYSRLGPSEDRVIEEPHGCGNALFDREALTLPDPVFDLAANEIGGEDDLLFARLKAGGAEEEGETSDVPGVGGLKIDAVCGPKVGIKCGQTVIGGKMADEVVAKPLLAREARE